MFVFGLGNPGSEYAHTRHNVGFMTVEKIAALKGVKFRKRSFRPYRRAYLDNKKDCLVEPLTYMNESGTIIPGLVEKDEPLIVICDQMDLPVGRVRIKRGGSSAGHNGLKSIIAAYGENFIRVYIGIGHPVDKSVVDHVLSDFTEEEKSAVESAVERAGDAVVSLLEGRSLNEVMQRVNSQKD